MGRWIADQRLAVYVAERDGAVAGVGALSESGDVLLNYVAPAHRFAGVSRAVLAHLEQALRERGISWAVLSSTRTAHRFHRAAGWLDVGPPQPMFGMFVYPMAKQL
jgi:GNAT superfamily N-acetyltransferase